MSKVKTAVFPVGGLGTRFLPATKSMPKEMLPIVDKPLVQYAFEEAREAGIERFVFVTGRNKNAISNHFDHAYELETILTDKNKRHELQESVGWLPPAGSVYFTRQQKPLGLGHAVWCARHVVGNEPFAVLLADDLMLGPSPCLKQMADAYAGQGGGNMVAVEEIDRAHSDRYGILNPKSRHGQWVAAADIVEKPKPADAPSTTAVTGRYILEPGIFEYLERQPAGAGGEIQLTDAMRAALHGGTPLNGFYFEGKRFDCGNKAGFLEATVAYALQRPDLAGDMRRILADYAG